MLIWELQKMSRHLIYIEGHRETGRGAQMGSVDAAASLQHVQEVCMVD